MKPKSIILTLLLAGLLLAGFGAFASADGRSTSTNSVSGNNSSMLTSAMSACGYSTPQQTQFLNALTSPQNSLLSGGSVLQAHFAIWTNDLSFYTTGDAIPGYAWGKNNSNEPMQFWYGNNAFVGMRTSSIASLGKSNPIDYFCGTYGDDSTTHFTLNKYANQPPIHGNFWVWW